MNEINSRKHAVLSNQKGFSLMEMIILIAIIGILAAIAIPEFTQMRQGLEYRQAARAVSQALRDARNQAIRDNLQYRVELQLPRAYAITRGDRAYDAQVWSVIPADRWLSLPTSVTLTTTPVQANIAFNPNGTASNVAAAGVTINVFDIAGTARFRIQVTPIGKITIL